MHSLRPIFALFARSLRDDTRARLPTILRVALILIILLILWSNQRSFTARTAPGREFFLMVMMLNLGFIAVAALSIFPAAVAEEKEDETLPLLRMTNLSPVAILFGKSTSRLVAAFALLAVQVPFTLLAITLGGVSLSQVWGAYAVLGATTFFLCNLALFASVYARTIIRAGFVTGFIAGILYAVLPMIGLLTFVSRIGPAGIGSGGSTAWERFWSWLMQANPLWALVGLLETRSGWTVNNNYLWFNLGGGLVCFLLAWALFDRCCVRTLDLAPTPRLDRRGRKRRWARVTRPWRRALAWKDFHFMIGGRFGLYLRLALAASIFGAICWIVIANERPFRHSERWEIICVMTLFVAGCAAATEILLLAGRLFGTERKRQTLSSLVTLPWHVGRIIRQKVLGCLPILLPWLVLALVGIAVAWEDVMLELSKELAHVDWDWKEIREVSAVGAYLVVQAVFFLFLIVWLSLKLRRGALPVAIAVITLWNIIFGLCLDETSNRHIHITFIVGIYLTIPAVIMTARGVYTGIQTAAAQD